MVYLLQVIKDYTSIKYKLNIYNHLCKCAHTHTHSQFSFNIVSYERKTQITELTKSKEVNSRFTIFSVQILLSSNNQLSGNYIMSSITQNKYEWFPHTNITNARNICTYLTYVRVLFGDCVNEIHLKFCIHDVSWVGMY